jgi:rod shape-determining protein MreC
MNSQDRAQLFAKGADSTLALLVYAAAAIALMVLDRKWGYLNDVRAASQSLARPIWALAEMPEKIADASQTYLGDRAALAQKLNALAETSLLQNTELLALRAQAAETKQIHALIGNDPLATSKGQIARVLSVDLDRYSQRIAIGRGTRDGVMVNSVLVDEKGLLGQVTEVGADTAIAILLSDVNHRVPAEIVRNGVRVYVVGLGADAMLAIDRMALNCDIKIGDQIQTSGLGGVFPAGLPIGSVASVSRADGDSFAQANLIPAAKLGLSKLVLVLPPRPNIGPVFDLAAHAAPTTTSAPNAPGLATISAPASTTN